MTGNLLTCGCLLARIELQGGWHLGCLKGCRQFRRSAAALSNGMSWGAGPEGM